MVEDNKAQLPAEVVEQFESILIEATEAKDSQDLAQISAASEKLNQMMQNVSRQHRLLVQEQLLVVQLLEPQSSEQCW